MFKLVIFLALVTLVYSKPFDPDSCLHENDIWGETSHSLTGRLMQGETMSAKEQCYFKCVIQQGHLIDEDGNFTPRESITYLAALLRMNLTESELNRVEKRTSHCGFPHIENLCERGMNIKKCFTNALY